MIDFFKKLKCFSKQLYSVGVPILLFTASTSYAANIEPFADALATPTTGTAPLEVTLDGSRSVDSDGEIVKYEWTSSDGQTIVEGETATLTFETEGEYTVKLVVTDDLGAVSTNVAEQTITVSSATDIPPTANFTATPTSGEAPLTVDVDASESSDDGEIVKYQWTSSDGQTAEGVTASFAFESVGEYEISLIVVDNEGLTSEAVKKTVTAIVTAIPTGDVEIGFMDLKDVYVTGEPLAITVEEISSNLIRAENVDLYVSILVGADILLFITDDPEDPFTTAMIPFKTDIVPSETEHTAFAIDALPFGLEGEYEVLAVYTEVGGNPISQAVSSIKKQVKIVGVNAEIAFDGMKSVYSVGETMTITVAETSLVHRAEKVDLWVAVQMPDGSFLFMSSLLPSFFSINPIPFATGIDHSKTEHSVFEFVVPAGLEGNYTLLAVYMKEGENPLFRQDMMMSNVATFPVELR